MARGVFCGQVVSFLEMACELFFSGCAPLPNGAHLVCGQVVATRPRGGTLRRPGFGVFAHDRIVAHDFSGQKAQFCNVRKRRRSPTGRGNGPGSRQPEPLPGRFLPRVSGRSG